MTLLILNFPGREKEIGRARVIFQFFFCFSIFRFKYDNFQVRLCYSDGGDDDWWTNRTDLVECLLFRMDGEWSSLQKKQIIQMRSYTI